MNGAPRPAQASTPSGFAEDAVDARTKIIAALKVGPRTQPTAHAVVHALVKVLAPDCIPVFTSDGLKLYFDALTAHFGGWAETVGKQTRPWQVRAELLYGQAVKQYRRRCARKGCQGS